VIGFYTSNLKFASKHAISSCARALIPNFSKKKKSHQVRQRGRDYRLIAVFLAVPILRRR